MLNLDYKIKQFIYTKSYKSIFFQKTIVNCRKIT
jgi:hypothetical protein